MHVLHKVAAITLVGTTRTGVAAAPANAAVNVYAATTSAKTNLSPNGGVPTTLLTLTIPKGSWLMSAKADPVNFGANDYERCGINVGGTIVDMSASNAGADPFVVNIKSIAAVTTSQSTTVQPFCQHDFNITGEYVDPDSWLIVQKVGVIN